MKKPVWIILSIIALIWLVTNQPSSGGGFSTSGGCSGKSLYHQTNVITITKRWSDTIDVNPEGQPQRFQIIIGAMDTNTPYTCFYNAGIKGAEQLVKVPAYSEWTRRKFTPVKVAGVMTAKLCLPPDALVETGQVYYAIVPAE